MKASADLIRKAGTQETLCPLSLFPLFLITKICVKREQGDGVAGKRTTQTGMPNGRLTGSELVKSVDKKPLSVASASSVVKNNFAA
jgi:hypothetical protein